MWDSRDDGSGIVAGHMTPVFSRIRLFVRSHLLPPRNRADWVVAGVLALAIAGACLSAAWFVRYGLAIHRLARGVGDTIFYGADGRPWFRLDEQRRDVPLDEISAH